MSQTTFKVQEESIALEMMRRAVSAELVDYPFMQERMEVVIQDLVYKMAKQITVFTDLPREQLKTVTGIATFKTPASWWQFFKASIFPLWLQNKFPVKWHQEVQEVKIEVGAVYPQLPQVFPKNLGTVLFHYRKIEPISSYPRIATVGEPLD